MLDKKLEKLLIELENRRVTVQNISKEITKFRDAFLKDDVSFEDKENFFILHDNFMNAIGLFYEMVQKVLHLLSSELVKPILL